MLLFSSTQEIIFSLKLCVIQQLLTCKYIETLPEAPGSAALWALHCHLPAFSIPFFLQLGTFKTVLFPLVLFLYFTEQSTTNVINITVTELSLHSLGLKYSML